MITTNAAEVIAILRGVAARTANSQPVLAAIGAAEVEVIRGLIEEGKTSPDGRQWEPWRPYTREQREMKGNEGQGLLWDTGTLLNSIRYQADAHSVMIGTDVEYAHELQYGRGGDRPMVARTFIGWNAAGLAHAERTMLGHIAGPLTP